MAVKLGIAAIPLRMVGPGLTPISPETEIAELPLLALVEIFGDAAREGEGVEAEIGNTAGQGSVTSRRSFNSIGLRPRPGPGFPGRGRQRRAAGFPPWADRYRRCRGW